jgi:hypothetical protein
MLISLIFGFVSPSLSFQYDNLGDLQHLDRLSLRAFLHCVSKWCFRQISLICLIGKIGVGVDLIQLSENII